MRIVLHHEARAELRAATLWYEEQRLGTGVDFVAEVRRVLDRIGLSPRLFPLWPQIRSSRGEIRRALVNRFPYVVAFEVQSGRILVLAIAHGRRRPFYWLSRAMGPPE